MTAASSSARLAALMSLCSNRNDLSTEREGLVCFFSLLIDSAIQAKSALSGSFASLALAEICSAIVRSRCS